MSARQVLQDTWVQLQTHDYGVWTTRSLFIYALSAVAVIVSSGSLPSSVQRRLTD